MLAELARIGFAKHVRWVKNRRLTSQRACETILRSNALGALVAWLASRPARTDPARAGAS
jgi:hypothetical protein